jgi:hypothetical protein
VVDPEYPVDGSIKSLENNQTRPHINVLDKIHTAGEQVK